MVTEIVMAEAAKKAVGSLVDKVIVPKIEQFAQKCNLEYNKIMIPRREHFEEYLFRSYNDYSVINTLVLKNEQRNLKDLYVPLTLVKEDYTRDNKTEKYRIDCYPEELMRKYNKILIIDTAGMGKSTLTKFMFLDSIENGRGIPFFIELRRLKKGWSILNEIQKQTNSLSKQFNSELLFDFIQTGGFIFFLDGFDEISLEERSDVTADIQEFVSKAGNNVFVLTSRPEQALSCFGDFQGLKINPLEKQEAYELLRNYDNRGVVANRLIEELETGQYDAIGEFLKNPLLVSLLFAAFEYKQKVPLKKHQFYRQVYDAYFDKHDLTKDNWIHDKHSKLDIDNFERVLRYLGYWCMVKHQIEFEKDSLLKLIEEANSFCSDLKFKASDFLKDLLSTVPLFCQDGQCFRWVHRSLQEYFAAQFIFKDSKEKQSSILKKIYNSDNIDGFLNILDLYYDIDYIGFVKNIEYSLLEEYIEFYQKNVFESPVINKKYIEQRIGCLFGQTVFIVSLTKLANFSGQFMRLENDARRNYFDEIRGIIKEKYKITIKDAVVIEPPVIYIGSCIWGHKKVLSILSRRRQDLFEPLKVFGSDNNMKFDLQEVDVHTGEDDYRNYTRINELIEDNNRFRSNKNMEVVLNYQKCCEEFDKIKIMIESNEKSLDLLEGL
ncbi:MAG: hypothetical protein IJR04_01625 [Bacteroidales bacterium]|nr:hypothetical protein [Bacteroidales bacterium]